MNFRTLIKDNFKMFSQKIYALEFRAATQSTDMSGGQINKGKLKSFYQSYSKKFSTRKIGSWKAFWF